MPLHTPSRLARSKGDDLGTLALERIGDDLPASLHEDVPRRLVDAVEGAPVLAEEAAECILGDIVLGDVSAGDALLQRGKDLEVGKLQYQTCVGTVKK